MTSHLPTADRDTGPPLTATERVIAALWSEVLDLPQLPHATDNFFSVGGDSMTMAIVESRIQEELLAQMPPGAILGAPTLCELSALVDAACLDLPSPSDRSSHSNS